MPTPPEPDQQQIALPRPVDEALQCAIGRHAGAHQRRGLVDRKRGIVEQIFRVGHQHVGRESAVEDDAEKTILQAEIFVTVETVAALAAADPWEDRLLGADQALVGVRSDLIDDACDLVAHREGQNHAARGVEPPAAAEIGIAVLDMQVGMAQPAAIDADQHLLALGFWCVGDGLAKRSIEFHERLSTHLRHAFFSLKKSSNFRSVYRPIHGPWQQSRKPEWFRRGGSDRHAPRARAARDRPAVISGSDAASCGADRTRRP